MKSPLAKVKGAVALTAPDVPVYLKAKTLVPDMFTFATQVVVELADVSYNQPPPRVGKAASVVAAVTGKLKK